MDEVEERGATLALVVQGLRGRVEVIVRNEEVALFL